MEMGDLLKRGMNGGNLLFCGAGFSADCLNLSKNDFQKMILGEQMGF